MLLTWHQLAVAANITIAKAQDDMARGVGLMLDKNGKPFLSRKAQQRLDVLSQMCSRFFMECGILIRALS